MKQFKLHMTRPEFLKKILTKGDIDHDITEEDLKELAERGYIMPYCCYTVLMNANLRPSDVLQVHDDSETIVVKLTSKSMAKEVKELFHKEIIRIGMKNYRLKIKVDGSYIFLSVLDMDPDEEE